ncbi:VOC family protein [Pigmentiphaga litoralis]|uniref:Catechol 2,3-dioxygenase-like lactoylglutathione lyase family enzyme n=1 Tax=Pigmentiphaga litoralis TaxID=516702 RepID=A0A7Y9LLH5_9BURK|nr:VOC family protein [Pigmentiphaga litoralis]NYE25161.1 catechol 2,3-dioxygenase-like lactoylglutathione lyase family enzyme [Pigmentiphaga litoralis]NYE81225.1 catechol 2,3-dioxygenase-like lactoylglutathione lyase family enzyme [Pigmentiphaga litoralis]
MRITNALIDSRHPGSVVKPEYLSHGTLECYSVTTSRRFYEEFLGLECVRHGKRSMAIRCGMAFHIVCLHVGNRLRPCSVDNHWGIDVASAEEVDRIWKAAGELKDTYGIHTITQPVDQHGTYSFYIEDLDHNWWEIQFYDGIQHEDMFDFGDRFTDADLPDAFK